MFDFDLDLDFGELEVKSVQLPINALALKVLGKERQKTLYGVTEEIEINPIYTLTKQKTSYCEIKEQDEMENDIN